MHPLIRVFRRLTHGVQQGKIGQSAKQVPPAATAGKLNSGQPVGLIQFRGNDDDPQQVSASIFSFDANDSNGVIYGPLVAMISWGAGHGGQHEAEVDLPSSQYDQTTRQNAGGVGVTSGSGVIITVPCSTLNVAVRNDAALIPFIGDKEIGQISTFGAAMAHIGVGNRPGTTVLRRTIWQVNASPGLGLPHGGSTQILIPPFAKSVKILRNGVGDIALAMTVGIQTISPLTNIIENINVAQGTQCPEIVLPNNTRFINIVNADAAVEMIQLCAVFAIEL